MAVVAAGIVLLFVLPFVVTSLLSGLTFGGGRSRQQMPMPLWMANADDERAY